MAQFPDERTIRRHATARDPKTHASPVTAPLKRDKRPHQEIEPFPRMHARQETDDRRSVLTLGGGRVAVQADPVVHHRYALRCEPEPFTKCFFVILAHSHKHRDIRGPRAQQVPAALRIRKRVNETVLPLQRTDNGNPQLFANAPCEPDQEQVGQAYHLWAVFLLSQPGHHLFEFLRLPPAFTERHRNRHLAQVAGARHSSLGRGESQERRSVEKPVDPGRGAPEECQLLLKIDVDAAEKEGSIIRHALFIDKMRQIHRQQHRVVPHPPQRPHQRIIAQAGATIEVARAGGELNDAHWELLRHIEGVEGAILGADRHRGTRDGRRSA